MAAMEASDEETVLTNINLPCHLSIIQQEEENL